MNGVLLVDKPSGWTSFDVVNYVRKIVAQAEGKKPKNIKVGHTGTLDPLATGLLVLLVGKEYTKRAAELTKLDKTYEVTMRLGAVSSTGDAEGTITSYPLNSLSSFRRSSEKRQGVARVLEGFVGSSMQQPPAFSAVKVNGRRAYKLARAGKAVELEPRPVRIHRLELADYTYPDVSFVAEVSSGTYIRSLVEDIGKTLGTGAYMTSLRRTSVGKFSVDEALETTQLTTEVIQNHLLLN